MSFLLSLHGSFMNEYQLIDPNSREGQYIVFPNVERRRVRVIFITDAKITKTTHLCRLTFASYGV